MSEVLLNRTKPYLRYDEEDYGYCVGEGWHPILDRLFGKIVEICDKHFIGVLIISLCVAAGRADESSYFVR